MEKIKIQLPKMSNPSESEPRRSVLIVIENHIGVIESIEGDVATVLPFKLHESELQRRENETIRRCAEVAMKVENKMITIDGRTGYETARTDISSTLLSQVKHSDGKKG